MAKTTRTDKPNGNVTVMEPAEPQTQPAQPAPNAQEDADDSEDTTFQETATAEEVEKRRGRGHHKEASAGFFARISAYSTAEWEKLLLYIYRLFPITDRKASGEPVTYIAKLSEPIDEEYILKEPNWGGSGKYRVRLNRTNVDGKNTPIDVVEFVVENLKYPPRVPPGEWVDDPRNKRWAWAKTYYDGKEPPAAAPTPPQPAGPSITELIEGVRSLKELTKEAAPPPPPPAPDPVAQLSGTVEAVSKIVDMARPAAAPPPDNGLEKFLLAELSAERAANRDLMGKLLDRANAPAAAPPPDPLRDIAIKLLEKRLEKLDEPPGESAAERQSRMSGTHEFIVEMGRVISPVAEKAIGLFTVMAAAKQPPPTTRTTRPPATVDVAPAGTTTEQPQPPAQPESAPNPPTPEEIQQAIMQEQLKMLGTFLGQILPTMLDYLENSDGTAFGEQFCNSSFVLPGVMPPMNRKSGVEIFGYAKMLGKTAIMDAYKSNTVLYQQIAPTAEAEQKFIQFIDDFLAYKPPAEDDEEDQD